MKLHVRLGNKDDLGVCAEVQTQDAYRVKKLAFQPKRVVDLGGHIGSFTRMAHKYWPKAIIHAYEVDEPTRAVLNLNATGLRNISVFGNYVLGWYLNEKEHPVYPGNTMEQEYRAQRHQTCISAKMVLARIGSIDFLKIDVEQSEVNILTELAALGALKNIRCIHGEWHFDEAKRVVREVVGQTHHVELVDEGQWNLFWATLK